VISTATSFDPRVQVRRGPGHWLRGYASMLTFELINQRLMLPIMLFVQIMLGAGMAIMYGFYFGGGLPPRVATYLASGIPALALIPVGFMGVSVVVGQQRVNRSYVFVWSLPVPRLAAAAATFTVYTLVAVPGTVVALAVAAWRYDAAFSVHPSIVTAVALASLMSTSVGFGMAHAIEDPRITNLIGNVLVFVVLLFSPIVAPIEQFPHWLAVIHRCLPFYHMAVVVRGGLTDGMTGGLATSYLVLTAWTAAGWLVAWRAISHRR